MINAAPHTVYTDTSHPLRYRCGCRHSTAPAETHAIRTPHETEYGITSTVKVYCEHCCPHCQSPQNGGKGLIRP